MLIPLATLAIGVMLIIGTLLLFSRKAGEDGRTGSGKPKDEKKGFWQYFGLVDNSPNLFRAVVAGNESSGPVIKIIATFKDMRYDPKLKRLVPLKAWESQYPDENMFEEFVRVAFGKLYYGLPFIRNVKPLYIDRVVDKDTNAAAGQSLENQLEASMVKRYGLYREIQRPTYHKNVDTKDGVRFNVNSYAFIEVENPEPAFEIYADNLLQTISKIISGFVSSKVILMDWDEYKTAGEKGNKFSKTDIEELNILLNKLGLKVTQLTMSDPEANESVQEALERKKKAQEDAAAKRLQGEGEKDYLISVGEGNARVIERIAKANAERFNQLIELYTKNGLSKKDAVDKANAMIAAEFNADAIGKLTGTYAPGLGSGVIGFGGDKK